MSRSLRSALEDKLVYTAVAALTLAKFVGAVILFVVGSPFASLMNKYSGNTDLTL